MFPVQTMIGLGQVVALQIASSHAHREQGATTAFTPLERVLIYPAVILPWVQFNAAIIADIPDVIAFEHLSAAVKVSLEISNQSTRVFPNTEAQCSHSFSGWEHNPPLSRCLQVNFHRAKGEFLRWQTHRFTGMRR